MGLQCKVKFPTTYDDLGIVLEDLDGKLTKVNRRLVELEKSRAEQRKARVRRRGLAGRAEAQDMDVSGRRTGTSEESQ